jgi:hypothetical protein
MYTTCLVVFAGTFATPKVYYLHVTMPSAMTAQHGMSFMAKLIVQNVVQTATSAQG